MHLATTLRSYHGKSCPYCNRPMDLAKIQLMPTRDHYPIPKSRGGRRTIICCLTCNHLKADMAADAWEAFIVENRGGWFVARPPGMAMPPISHTPIPSILRAKPLPYAESLMILRLGKRAWKAWKEQQTSP